MQCSCPRFMVWSNSREIVICLFLNWTRVFSPIAQFARVLPVPGVVEHALLLPVARLVTVHLLRVDLLLQQLLHLVTLRDVDRKLSIVVHCCNVAPMVQQEPRKDVSMNHEQHQGKCVQPGNGEEAAGGGGMKRGPPLVISSVDVGAVGHQELHHVQVVINASLGR